MEYKKEKNTLILNHVGKLLKSAIAVALLGLLAWILPGGFPQVYDAILAEIPPKYMLAILCLSLIANIAMLSYIFSSLRAEPKLHARFGVYWDKKGNPYCPKCKTLTTQVGWVTYKNGQRSGLKCSCADKPFLLMESGETINVEDAMKAMQKT